MNAVQQAPSASSASRGNRRRGRGGGQTRSQPSADSSAATGRTPNNHQDAQLSARPVPSSSRARKFGGQLSGANAQGAAAVVNARLEAPEKPKQAQKSNHLPDTALRYQVEGVAVPELTARLIETLKAPPYAECIICFAPILPQQPVWSCAVSEETNRCCWAVFHNKCIYSWSKKSMQETKAAFAARNDDREGEWRCPSCQTVRTSPPGPYRCFCGAVVDPKPGRLALPHSCGMTCSRKRTTCNHRCQLPCHPAKCPNCTVVIVENCYCGKQTVSLRCSRMATVGESPLSCGSTCGRLLGCKKHRCEDLCHKGECTPCKETNVSRCYCGRETQEIHCGEGVSQSCLDEQNKWEGMYSCEAVCKRPYACGKHHCKKELCHPHSPADLECPKGPNKIQTCACGKMTLDELGISRTACTDPLPCCSSKCSKPREECEHPCSATCHIGACPPCQVMISLPCRCGETVQQLPCWQRTSGEEEILCNRSCRALRNCGKHVCNRICCPLAHVRNVKQKGRHNAPDHSLENLELHECDVTCNKLLNCGLHRCERKDHKGLCPPCLQSSFDEMTCACGKTTLMPPIPCGTQMECPYPCTRPPPPCGHPRASHTCHEEPSACPPCSFLTSKLCNCGKMTLTNVRCSQMNVSCGTPCNRLLACGSHNCSRLCHSQGEDCGPCENICGKSRKLCLPETHPCTLKCHAPSACPEVEPCSSIVVLECPCGRIRRQVSCGKSIANSTGRSSVLQPKCTSECQISQRNARLAEALGIDPASPGKSERQVASYTPELTAFARSNLAFVRMVEGTLSEFVTTERKTHALPHMPEAKRHFVYNLCKVYRIDCRMVDVEPQRSVELIRRIDTRIPAPLLSSSLQAPSSPSLGKLQTITRASANTSPARTSAALPSGAGTGRAWASVASKMSPAPSGVPLPLPSHHKQRPFPANATTSSSTPQRPPSPEVVPADWEADD